MICDVQFHSTSFFESRTDKHTIFICWELEKNLLIKESTYLDCYFLKNFFRNRETKKIFDDRRFWKSGEENYRSSFPRSMIHLSASWKLEFFRKSKRQNSGRHSISSIEKLTSLPMTRLELATFRVWNGCSNRLS